jgi:hypothetical protein
MSAVLVILVLLAAATTLVLVHQDGIRVGQERAMTETEKRMRNLRRYNDLTR